jgi:hypothetical protein
MFLYLFISVAAHRAIRVSYCEPAIAIEITIDRGSLSRVYPLHHRLGEEATWVCQGVDSIRPPGLAVH